MSNHGLAIDTAFCFLRKIGVFRRESFASLLPPCYCTPRLGLLRLSIYWLRSILSQLSTDLHRRWLSGLPGTAGVQAQARLGSLLKAWVELDGSLELALVLSLLPFVCPDTEHPLRLFHLSYLAATAPFDFSALVNSSSSRSKLDSHLTTRIRRRGRLGSALQALLCTIPCFAAELLLAHHHAARVGCVAYRLRPSAEINSTCRLTSNSNSAPELLPCLLTCID